MFLEPENRGCSTWYEIDNDKSVERVCQVLRTLVKNSEKDNTRNVNSKNKWNANLIKVTSSAAYLNKNSSNCNTSQLYLYTEVPYPSASNQEIEKKDQYGKSYSGIFTITKQHSNEDIDLILDEKRIHESVYEEASKNLKYKDYQVIVLISSLGKSFLARLMLRPKSRSLVRDIAKLDKVINSTNHLLNIMGRLPTRIERLEKEIQRR